jgi:hypothetical protein
MGEPAGSHRLHEVSLIKIRRAAIWIKDLVPEAMEKISYQMPAYSLNGIIAWFGGFNDSKIDIVRLHYCEMFGHTPVSLDENIPWDCKVLIIGTGQNESLPVMNDVKEAAESKKVKLSLMSTPEAVKHLNDEFTNFILHLTC